MIIKSCKCDFTGWLFSCSDSLINFTLLSTPQRKKKKQRGHWPGVTFACPFMTSVFVSLSRDRPECFWQTETVGSFCLRFLQLHSRFMTSGPLCHARVMAFLFPVPCMSSNDIVYIITDSVFAIMHSFMLQKVAACSYCIKKKKQLIAIILILILYLLLNIILYI